jgi:hypothetical protein
LPVKLPVPKEPPGMPIAEMAALPAAVMRLESKDKKIPVHRPSGIGWRDIWAGVAESREREEKAILYRQHCARR